MCRNTAFNCVTTCSTPQCPKYPVLIPSITVLKLLILKSISNRIKYEIIHIFMSVIHRVLKNHKDDSYAIASLVSRDPQV